VTRANPLTIDDIISIEPRIGGVLENIDTNAQCLKRYVEYSNAKRQLMKLVGWGAENICLCSSQAYDVVIDAVLVKLNLK